MRHKLEEKKKKQKEHDGSKSGKEKSIYPLAAVVMFFGVDIRKWTKRQRRRAADISRRVVSIYRRR